MGGKVLGAPGAGIEPGQCGHKARHVPLISVTGLIGVPRSLQAQKSIHKPSRSTCERESLTRMPRAIIETLYTDM